MYGSVFVWLRYLNLLLPASAGYASFSSWNGLNEMEESLDNLEDFHSLAFENEYATIKKIGSGGQANVWLVKRQSDNIPFALKEIGGLDSDVSSTVRIAKAALKAELNARVCSWGKYVQPSFSSASLG